MTSIYLGGTFDLPHAGHVALFRAAAEHGPVTVSLNTDEFAARYKRRPILSLQERIAVIREFRTVHRVIVNTGNEDSRRAILQSGCDLIAHGDDWTGIKYLDQLGVTQAWLDEHGLRIVYLPYTGGISTSEIIGRIRCE